MGQERLREVRASQESQDGVGRSPHVVQNSRHSGESCSGRGATVKPTPRPEMELQRPVNWSCNSAPIRARLQLRQPVAERGCRAPGWLRGEWSAWF